MASPFDLLVDLIHSTTLDSWKDRNEKALAAIFGTRYNKRAEKSVALRAPDMKGNEAGIPYAAYIDPSNADAVLEEYFAAQSVPVEMHRVERHALRLGRAQTFGELLEGGWPQHFQLERLARLVTQPSNEMPRYRAEPDSVVFQPADRQQDPNLPLRRSRHTDAEPDWSDTAQTQER